MPHRSGKGTQLITCKQCGRHVRYLWCVGGILCCRRCSKQHGAVTVYPAQALLRFGGLLPAQTAPGRRTA